MSIVRNPSPPPGYETLPNEDKIGDSDYSRHFILSSLSSVIQLVNKDENEFMGNEECSSQNVKELNTGIEDKMCFVWDISSNKDVSRFLIESDIGNLIPAVVNRSRYPRLNEILIGILANVCTDEESAVHISKLDSTCDLIQSFIQSDDSATVIQVMRLLSNNLKFKAVGKSIESKIIHSNYFFEILLFILKNSLNGDLLQATIDLILNVMDFSESIHLEWSSNEELIHAVLAAFDERKKENIKDCQYFSHFVQYASCTEAGKNILMTKKECIIADIVAYLNYFSIELEISTHLYDSIAAAIAVLNNLLEYDQDFIMEINLKQNELLVMIIRILHCYMRDELWNKSDIDTSKYSILQAITEFLGTVLDQIKTIESLQDICLSQLNIMYSDEIFYKSIQAVKKHNAKFMHDTILKKILEKKCHDDYIHIQNDLNFDIKN